MAEVKFGVAEEWDESDRDGYMPISQIVNEQSNGVFQYLHRFRIAKRLAMKSGEIMP
jgi:hypothetical protein